MWVSKKKFTKLEKRIADLEVQVQSQQKQKFVPEDSDRSVYKQHICQKEF